MLNDIKTPILKNKCNNLKLEIDRLQKNKLQIENKYNTKIKTYDNLINTISKKENDTSLKLNNLIQQEKVILNINNKTNISLKESEFNKEIHIYINEQSRIIEKKSIVNNEYKHKIDELNKYIFLLESNINDIENKITFIQCNNKIILNEKYNTRLNIKNNLLNYKKKVKLNKNKNSIFKNKINDIDVKIHSFNKEYEINIEKKKTANYIFYDIKNKIDNLNILLCEIQHEINIILSDNNSDVNIVHNNIQNNKVSFNKKEILLLNKVKEKENIQNQLTTYLNKPEYNLSQYYNLLNNKNKNLLKKIEILTNNKLQIQYKLNNESKTDFVDKSSDTIITKINFIKNNKKYINKLKSRLLKNRQIIIDNRNEIKSLHVYYQDLLNKEDIYDLNSKKRLQISKERTTIKYGKLLDINNNKMDLLNNEKQELNNNLVVLKKEKILIKQKQQLFVSNNKHYIINITNEIINNKKRLDKYNFLLK